MKIEKLSKKIDIDVEAQAKPCNRDCPSGITYVNNKSLADINTNYKPMCKPVVEYSSFISTKW